MATLDLLELILTGQVASGIYTLETEYSIQAIETLVEARGFCFLHLDGSRIFNVEQFYHDFGLMIDYPTFADDKHSANANRLWDVLGDLEMWASKCQQNIHGYIVLYSHFENWLQNGDHPIELYSIEGTISLIKEALAEQRTIEENELHRKGAIGEFGQYFLLKGDTHSAAKLNVFPVNPQP